MIFFVKNLTYDDNFMKIERVDYKKVYQLKNVIIKKILVRYDNLVIALKNYHLHKSKMFFS